MIPQPALHDCEAAPAIAVQAYAQQPAGDNYKRHNLPSGTAAPAAGDQGNVVPTRAKAKRVSRARSVAAPSCAAAPSLEELLVFERLLSALSVRFANVTVDQVVPEIESAQKQLLAFLGFDRSAFWEFIGEDKQNFLCSAALDGVEPPAPGPIPDDLSWFSKELRAGRSIVIRSDQDIPPQAAAAAEYNRRAGIRSVLVIPLPVGGRVVAAIGFGSFRSTRKWPAHFIARITVIGEVMAHALLRKRSEAALRA